MDDYNIPPISESDRILHPSVWELLADADALQAGLAGSRTWDLDREGVLLRAEQSREAKRIAACARRFDLESAAEALEEIATMLEEYSRNRG